MSHSTLVKIQLKTTGQVIEVSLREAQSLKRQGLVAETTKTKRAAAQNTEASA